MDRNQVGPVASRTRSQLQENSSTTSNETNESIGTTITTSDNDSGQNQEFKVEQVLLNQIGGDKSSKYDQFIEQQLIKDKINNVQKFSGNKYEDVSEWLRNVEQDFPSTLVSEDIKLKIVPKGLTNDA